MISKRLKRKVASITFLRQKQQEAISQKEIVFRFRKKTRKAAGVLISCALEVPWLGGFVLMRQFAPH